MQFTTLLVAAAAFSGVNAVAEFTNSAFNNLTAGAPFEFTWTGADGPVTIELKNGPSTNLNTVETITSGQTGTSFTWSVPSTLPADTYAFEIRDASGSNYSPQVQIIGATASVTSSAASSTGSSASSASSALSSSLSSISSSVSTALATLTGNSTSTAAATAGGNSTFTSASPTAASTTRAGATTAPTGTATGTGSVPNSNSGVASDFASPLALVFLTFAAIFTLN